MIEKVCTIALHKKNGSPTWFTELHSGVTLDWLSLRATQALIQPTVNVIFTNGFTALPRHLA